MIDTQEGTEQKKKRTTVADLEKRLDEMNLEDINKALEWCGELSVRLEDIEEGTAILQSNQSSLMKRYIEQQKQLDEEKPDGAVTNVTDRLTALENATGALADAVRGIVAGIADWGTRMEDAEDSIHSLQAAIPDMQENATHTEPVPLPRPVPEAGRYVDPDALKAVAQVAQTMNDVLMLTRVLKSSSELKDQERREILAIACQAAGVPYAENLLTRAGVRSFEA